MEPEPLLRVGADLLLDDLGVAGGVRLDVVPLVAGPAVVVASNVNVRGQARLKSEVVARVTKGQTVTVLEEIVRNNSLADEPSAWAKILLPTNAHVWVNRTYISATNNSVMPKKLNLRSGPGENYSVLGQLQAGDTVKELNAKEGWMEIEPPANAYAFVAAQFLKQEEPGAPAVAATEPAPATAPKEPAPATAPTEPAPAPTMVAEAPSVAPAPAEAPVPPPAPETPAVTNAPEALAMTNAPEEVATTNLAETAVLEEPPKRIVQREGVVRGTTSIQAPTHFMLVSPESGRTIDYLHTTSPNLDLRRYKGLHIIVTGEEGLDERWGNTPVITIQKIQVLE